MAKIVADIEMPDDGAPPAIRYPRNTFAVRPIFVVIVPPAGSEESARLFALCTERASPSSGAIFHKGPRPPASDVHAFLIETVDPEAVARLFERGNHPGDLRLVDAPRDHLGRDQTAVLAFLDLSQGLAHGDSICTPWDTRLGLAVACAELGGRQWAAAADVLDPARLMRDGVIATPGGNPMTSENFHRFMLDATEKTNRRMDVSHHPMRDFRLLQVDELLEEITRDARAIMYGCPDLPPDGPAIDLLKNGIDGLAETLRTRGDHDAAYSRLRTQMAAVMADRPTPPAIRRLLDGQGPGAVCWRNLFAPNGLITTAWRRVRSPESTGRLAEATSRLPHWAKRAVLDPSTILTGSPKTLDQARATLGDRHRPYLSLPASRLAAAPGLQASLSGLPGGHAESLLNNTSLLLTALDEIENLHALLPYARDAVAVGWHAIARTIAESNPERSAELSAAAPDFVTARALALPFLSAEPAFHRSLGVDRALRL